MTTITILLALAFAMVASSIIEWYLHKAVLHGHGDNPAAAGHESHHDLFGGGKFQGPHTSENLGLAPHVLRRVSALVTQAAAALAWLVHHPGLVAAVTALIATVGYMLALKLVHTRIHMPKAGGWFEATWLYHALKRHHGVHHAREDVNYCILWSLADIVLGTAHRPAKARAEA
jgi:hypothetical protein